MAEILPFTRKPPRTRKPPFNRAPGALPVFGLLFPWVVIGVLVAAALAAGAFSHWHQTKSLITETGGSAYTGRISSADIKVIDGDTIRANGDVFRLVGYDTPEKGSLAKCPAERKLADQATSRLRQIVARDDLRLDRVACACPPGTEGTHRCNYGRLCGKLTASGRDVGAILIGEGLARSYICRSSSCPPRQGWC
jgi:endonuclease YncB( thermonuclease family)